MIVVGLGGKVKKGTWNNSMNPLNCKECIDAMIAAIVKTSGDIRFLGAGYDNLSNFGLKSIVVTSVMWYAEKEGNIISKYNVAKLLMCSLLKKAEGEIKKEVKTDLCKALKVKRDFFDVAIPYTEFRKVTSVEAANEMFFGATVTAMERRIVGFAGVLTTLAELINIRYKLEDSFYQRRRIEMELRCEQYSDMPGFDELKNRLDDFAEIGRSLSEQIRWKLQVGGNRASVLKHIAITGILCFFNALEVRDDPEEAGKCFFMGIYHDLPEVWTGDIPSSYKDRDLEEILESYFFKYGVKEENVAKIFEESKTIFDSEERIHFFESEFYKSVGTVTDEVKDILEIVKNGTSIRDAVEAVEEGFMTKNFYSKFPVYEHFDMQEKAKELMFEEDQNKDEYFKMIKGIDYVGAVLEVYLIYLHGSCDPYYLGADARTLQQIESGKYELGQNIVEVFKEYKLKTERLLNSSYNHNKVEELERKVAQLSAQIALLSSGSRDDDGK